ncbi:MAG: SGNH/GDSL hydrolase family protein [Prevotella sp.]|nr:SGNH/GDSL hydrolase family protein [Prevotella sp.]
MKKCTILCAVMMAATMSLSAQGVNGQSSMVNDFTGTWAAAAEWTGRGDMPRMSLAGNTLREIIQVSIGGEELQLQLSNEFSKEPVEIKSIYVADALDSCDIDRKTVKELKFGGQKSVTIAPGETAMSDNFAYKLKPRQRLAVTICYGEVPVNMTSHRGSRTTSFIATGQIAAKKKFETAEKLEHWYSIAQLNVRTDGQVKAVAVLGNSITDGRGSTTNLQNRWPDMMAANLDCGVLNLGIGGNCVVRGGLSEPALKRFDRDILGQKNVDRLIIFQGTNDIGTSPHAENTAKELKEAYKTLIKKAREAGIKKVYGATITAFKGNGWYSPYHEAARQDVNEWIRTSGEFDGVIDFDELTRDPSDREKLKKELSEDWLHLNAEGYRVMGEYAAKFLKTKQ